MKHKTKKLITGIVCLLVVAGLIYLYFRPTTSGNTVTGTNADAFAKCLTQNGAKMYGASWCPHCQAQKEMFGSSFQYVTYVECAAGSGQAAVCTQAGIEGYPTWIFKDGSRQAGQMTFTELSQKSGCPLELIKT